MSLCCADCGAEAHSMTRGWLAVHAQVPDEDEQPLVVIYCPECAEREFGGRSRIDRRSDLDDS
jgi:DNA-directed RNA polymerase subunit RPC12/RpoP